MEPERKQELFQRGIACFNARRFFECHEALEEIWLSEVPEEKPFYQGLIQVAAGFHHYQNGNLAGASSLIHQGLEKLAAYPPDHHGIDLAGLRAGLAPWLERCSSGTGFVDLTFPTIRPAD